MKKIAITRLSLFFLFSLGVYVLCGQHVSKYRQGVRTSDALLYVAPAKMLEIAAVNFKSVLSKLLFFRATTYAGGRSGGDAPLDLGWLYKMLDASTLLDPYNIDSYYFAQAAFSWSSNENIKKANKILERGIQYRDWDYYLPFFVGFNYSHFLKEYKKASRYFDKAAKLNPTLIDLAIKAHFRANEIPMAIAILKTVHQNTENEHIKEDIDTRIKAYEGALTLQKAVQKYRESYGHPPKDITFLIREDIISKIPRDPYGGYYYYNQENDIVESTSRFRSIPLQKEGQ